MTNEKTLNRDELKNFTGSEHWYRINKTILCTDGAKYVAETGGAYWLLGEIALSQAFEKKVAAEEFQVWVLKVNPDQTARLKCEDGNGHTVYSKKIPWTDFPLPEITLWYSNNVIYLPSEH